MSVLKGQLWRERETELHRKWGAQPQTARVCEFLADGRVRLRKVSGWGVKQTRTIQRERLLAKWELVRS